MSSNHTFDFDNSYAKLPAHFFAHAIPGGAPAPTLLGLNTDLANSLKLDPQWLASDEGIEILSGNRIPDGAEPLAMAYAGHQFGNFVPQLGDGRATLLGEVVDLAGTRLDVQLKGGGRTAFSRGGDGRAELGPVLREYIVSEAMAAFGVPTTRALAALRTGENIRRDGLLPGAIFVRVARSHIRVGTFQFFAVRQDIDGLRTLADYVIARLYPSAAKASNPYLALLDAVISEQAALVAHWQSLGFIHGVMNTDNVSVAGETIDYGPCAFMDGFNAEQVYSSIDRNGRYAYQNQPSINQWNMAILAQCLLPLLHDDQELAVAIGQQSVDDFADLYQRAYMARMCAKIGIQIVKKGDGQLVSDLLEIMQNNAADFTNFFRILSGMTTLGSDMSPELAALFLQPESLSSWLEKWRGRLAAQDFPAKDVRTAMRAVNPAFIPRNHLIEKAIQAARNANDLAPFDELVQVLAHPFDDQPEYAHLAIPPRPDQVVTQTFCGT